MKVAQDEIGREIGTDELHDCLRSGRNSNWPVSPAGQRRDQRLANRLDVFNHRDGQPFRGDLQWQLLCRALKLVKPAGRVVYSTCSFRPEENEMVVDKVIREGRARLIPISIPGFNASSGLTQWGNAQLDPSLVGAMRVWPHQNDTGGFFLALLERTA